jgi:hypothetical protein
VSWEDRTPQEREALKKRRTRRRNRKQRLTVRMWSERDLQARSPADRAQMYYDLCRRQIRAIRGGGAQDMAYTDLAAALLKHARTLPGADQILALVDTGERS